MIAFEKSVMTSIYMVYGHGIQGFPGVQCIKNSLMLLISYHRCKV